MSSLLLSGFSDSKWHFRTCIVRMIRNFINISTPAPTTSHMPHATLSYSTIYQPLPASSDQSLPIGQVTMSSAVEIGPFPGLLLNNFSAGAWDKEISLPRDFQVPPTLILAIVPLCTVDHLDNLELLLNVLRFCAPPCLHGDHTRNPKLAAKVSVGF
jgi:hypothetical protein